ncbi:MAG: hypothetical protein HQK97_12835 [Nitrospirae bacterium]|nr:hypothetical protein [Nitrospirota bacterium]
MTTEILYVKDVNSPLMRASTTYQRYHHMIFRNSLWVAVNFAALGVGILILWRRRLRDREAFIIVALSAAPLLSAIVTSAVTTAMVRYSYPTEIGNYLGAALLPILWRYHFLNIKNTPPASIINPTI